MVLLPNKTQQRKKIPANSDGFLHSICTIHVPYICPIVMYLVLLAQHAQCITTLPGMPNFPMNRNRYGLEGVYLAVILGLVHQSHSHGHSEPENQRQYQFKPEGQTTGTSRACSSLRDTPRHPVIQQNLAAHQIWRLQGCGSAFQKRK
jgi:hypothetical protein